LFDIILCLKCGKKVLKLQTEREIIMDFVSSSAWKRITRQHSFSVSCLLLFISVIILSVKHGIFVVETLTIACDEIIFIH
jgi:hypothetical protein